MKRKTEWNAKTSIKSKPETVADSVQEKMRKLPADSCPPGITFKTIVKVVEEFLSAESKG